MPTCLDIQDLGRLHYAAGLQAQRRAHGLVTSGQSPGVLLLTEHEPVITISRRRGAGEHLLIKEDALARMGISVHETDRGGDVTYHGPGQLVVYPILRLNDYRLNIGRYMRLLESAVIDVARLFGVKADREDGIAGVWVSVDLGEAVLPVPSSDALASSQSQACCAARPTADDGSIRAKLCATGVRVEKGVTLHGLALNVHTNLEHFKTIVPCGLFGRGVTSLTALLGDSAPGIEQVKLAVVDSLRVKLADRCGLNKPPSSPGDT